MKIKMLPGSPLFNNWQYLLSGNVQRIIILKEDETLRTILCNITRWEKELSSSLPSIENNFGTLASGDETVGR